MNFNNFYWKSKTSVNCRIWTCAGDPMRFQVSRLNHSAKLTTTCISSAKSLLKQKDNQGRLLKPFSKNIQYAHNDITNCSVQFFKTNWLDKVSWKFSLLRLFLLCHNLKLFYTLFKDKHSRYRKSSCKN